MKRRLLTIAVLALAVLALFWPVTGYDFINLDDGDYVARNSQVAGGLSRQGLAWAFTSVHAGNWHPLTWISHMLDVELYGMRAGRHHLTSLALHAASTVLLFGLMVRLTAAPGKSLFVAAVFAAHPLHVESVAWVAERKDVLSVFLWMLGVAAYLRYLKDRKSWWYALVCAALALGLMAKPMVTTLPLVLLLLDYWPLGRIRSTGAAGPPLLPGGAGTRALIVEKLPLFALSAASGIVTLVAQDLSGAVKPLESYPFTVRLANAVVAYATYVAKALWPARLAVFYPHSGQSLAALQVLIAAAFLATTTVLVVRRRTSSPYLWTGWLWFLLALLPVSGLVQVGSHALADRYTYLPLVGLAVLAAWGAPELAGSRRLRRALATIACAAVVVLAALSRRQLSHWRNSESLMAHAVAVTEGNWLARHSLGLAYLEQGRLTEAAAQVEAALGIEPRFATAHLSLGLLHAARGRFADAEREYGRALRLNPDLTAAYNNLGKLYLDQGRAGEAYDSLRQALGRDPSSAEAHYNAGIALSALGRRDEAIAEYREAIRISPAFVEPRLNLGNALDDAGRTLEAVEQYRQAIALRPADPSLHYNIALALERGGAIEEAILHYREALRLDPGLVPARSRLEAVRRR